MRYEVDKRRRIVRVTPEREEDLYFLYLLIDVGDVVRGWTVREYKPDGTKEGERVKMFLGIKVEALEYHKFRGSLRVRGPVVEVEEGIEGVKGRRHTFDIVAGREVEIEKADEEALEAAEGVLEMAKGILPRILLVSVDDEEAAFAYVTALGVEVLYFLRNDARRGGEEGSLLDEFLAAVGKATENLRRRYNPDKVVLAGPQIILEQVARYVHGDRIPQSSGGLAGVYEFVRRGLYDAFKAEMGFSAYEKLLQLLATNSERVATGPKDVEEAASAGRIDALLVLDSFIKENPGEVWAIISRAYKSRSKIFIIREDTEIGVGLRAMGGVAAILRW
ncbi:mRNA surveillance protein Pelota [Pyrobaculum sp.]|uniref:mRNA surveillance protein Pelota n=1 Tax=Pyrobaculum sp. TaxID=2004705 RepID=UPI00316CBD5B